MPRKTVLLAGTEMDGRALRMEVQRRTLIGLPSRHLDRKRLLSTYGFDRDGAIESGGNLEIDPLKLTVSLLKRAQRNGVEVVSPTEVTAVEAATMGVFLTLDGAHVIAAGKVIAATGYEVLPELPKHKYELVSTWALATPAQAESALWTGRALVWEASDPYLYFRTTVDNRIIVGGEDAGFKDTKRRDALIAEKSKSILGKLGALLPEVKLVADYRWSGTFAVSPTGLPIIGQVSTLPNVFAILSSGGNGITFSVIAAQMARSWIMGQQHPHAKLFAV